MNIQFDIKLVMFASGLLIGITVHEAAHALSAKWLGDRTAEKMGRISLNPLRHFSPMGMLALFFLGFGWGRPVEVNIYNFKKPKFYYLLSSIAGPISNLLVCGLMLLLLHFVVPQKTICFMICLGIYLINAILAIVNLIPIPPLDGSKIWPCLIPGMRPISSGKWNGIWFIVVAVIFFSGAIKYVIGPILGFLALLLPAIQP